MLNLDQYKTINQTNAHESRSERYGFVSTKEICSVMADHGYLPTSVSESRTRTISKLGYQKHLVIFRRSDELDLKNVGDEILEIGVKGSHDGSSATEIMLRMLVLQCLNGLTVAKGESEIYKIRHNINSAQAVSDALIHLLDTGPELFAQVAHYKEIKLTDTQQIAYASEAIEMLNDAEKFVLKPVDLLAARRESDKKSDLWHTFNRVQENVVKGGVARTTLQGKSRKTREIRNIDRNISANKDLWALTERTAIKLLN